MIFLFPYVVLAGSRDWLAGLPLTGEVTEWEGGGGVLAGGGVGWRSGGPGRQAEIGVSVTDDASAVTAGQREER